MLMAMLGGCPANLGGVNLMSESIPALEEMTLRQLRKVASEYEVSRYSRMRKSELIEAIMARPDPAYGFDASAQQQQ
jgi:transcription termination factor Rho